MPTRTLRIWVPTRKYVGRTAVPTSVDRWTWTRRDGIRVRYTDGLECRSEYGTLREFLQALRKGYEHAREVLPED